MTDQSDQQDLEDRVEQLESTISKMLPGRRDALKLGGAALVGGAAMSGSASAGTQQAGTIGTANDPVDVEAEDINNADTVTTQDLVVNGTATGPFGSDLQGCRVFLSSDQGIPTSTTKIQFDTEIYDSGNNFDTTSHDWTCPEPGLYIAHAHARFQGGANGQDRRLIIGTSTDGTPSNQGSRDAKNSSTVFIEMETTTINKYNQGDTIAAYAANFDENDNLDSGALGIQTFLEVAFLGSL